MSFLNFTFLDLLDILIAALLLYQLYRLLRGTAAIRIFIGITAVYLMWKLVDAFHMDVLTEILGQFIGIGFLLLVIVFQQEIRRFLLMIGSATFSRRRRFFRQLLWLRKTSQEEENQNLDPVILACQNLADKYLGALVVLARNTPLGNYVNTGTALDARLSSTLLESIFAKNSPLHDGAVIIDGSRIEGAGTILPVIDNSDIPARYGLRHRAAAGITEKTDALCVVVSEETGKISLVHHGRIDPLEAGELKSKLLYYLSQV
jgi:diadenylate cyclase